MMEESDYRDEQQSEGWFCLRAAPKREHIAAANLRKVAGIEVFCPRIRYRKVTRRGKIWWVEPLFPGYLFAKYRRWEFERLVMATPGVLTVVRFGDLTPMIFDETIQIIREEINTSQEEGGEQDILLVRPSVELGEEVEVAEGAMSGMVGTVVEVLPAKERVRILLEFLGQEREVEVDLFSLVLSKKPVWGSDEAPDDGD